VRYDFSRIRGPKPSARENFEQLICQLLAEEMNAISINGRGGDGGIDCFILRSGNSIDVFQAKYFLGCLTHSQKRQIQQSLATVRRQHQLTRWVLCIPRDHTPAEQSWFESIGSPQLVIEWWGETKIRNLLARHPQIARQFFLDDRLVEEFARFRAEVSKLLGALAEVHIYAPISPKRDQSTPMDYLDRAKDIGMVLLDDLTLFSCSMTPFISIDFADIYTFIVTDSLLAATAPVVDYCLEKSPVPLILLPPSITELHDFINSLIRKTGRSMKKAQARINPRLLEAFLSAYEADPDSLATKQAYRKLTSEYPSAGFSVSAGLRKLQGLRESRKIQLVQEGGSTDLRTKDALEALNSVRPHWRNLKGQYIDALNLTFLLERWAKPSDPVRMISSAPSFAMAAERLFGNHSPVRTSHQYSYLLSSGAPEQGQQLEDDLAGLLRSADGLQRIVSAHGERAWHDVEEVPVVLSAFESFAPYYRKYLRPVDEMILSAFHLMPRTRSLGMRELYEFLFREAEIVKAFGRWWDYVTEMLRSFNEQLPRYDGTKELLRKLEHNEA
jgi:hypothetical protein